jgi:hypothetical protein
MQMPAASLALIRAPKVALVENHWSLAWTPLLKRLNVITRQFHQHFACSFVYKIFANRFLYLHFRFVLWRKNIDSKAALKMLVKLTPMVNFTNILLARLRQFPCAKKV